MYDQTMCVVYLSYVAIGWHTITIIYNIICVSSFININILDRECEARSLRVVRAFFCDSKIKSKNKQITELKFCQSMAFYSNYCFLFLVNWCVRFDFVPLYRFNIWFFLFSNRKIHFYTIDGIKIFDLIVFRWKRRTNWFELCQTVARNRNACVEIQIRFETHFSCSCRLFDGVNKMMWAGVWCLFWMCQLEINWFY